MHLTDRVRRRADAPVLARGRRRLLHHRQPRGRPQRRHERRRRARARRRRGDVPRQGAPAAPRAELFDSAARATRPSSACAPSVRCAAACRAASCASTTSRSGRSQSGKIEAVEALVRWARPGPGARLPRRLRRRGRGVRADDGRRRVGAGRGLPAGRRLARRARRRPAPLPVHVNVSSRELEQLDLPGVVASALADAGLDAADLVLEITETGLLERTQRPASRAAGDQGHRRADRARRLRHRLLVAELPRALPDRRAEARPRVHRAGSTATTTSPCWSARSSRWRTRSA